MEQRQPVRAARPAATGMRGAGALLAWLAVGLLLACQTPVDSRVATAEEKDAYAAALSALPQDPVTAKKRLEAFLAAHPNSPLADDVGEKLAAVELGLGRRSEAEAWLRFVLREHPDGDRAEAVRIALAGIARDRGDDAAARRVFAGARFERMDAAQRAVAYRMLAELATSEVDRARWLGELYRVTDGELARARIESDLDAALAGLSVAPMERLANQLGDRPPAARVHLRLAERALDAGDLVDANRRLARADALVLSERDVALRGEIARRMALREQLATAGVLPTFAEVSRLPAPRTDGAVGTLGVVLPLSGAFARFGEESLRGILLAAGIFDEITAAQQSDRGDVRIVNEPRIRLEVRDTAGSPEQAAAAVRELSELDDVVAIVGPLLAAEAEAAAQVAQQREMPLLTLTSREDVAAGRDRVFRLRTTPTDEVRFLVDHAVDELGARRFAVLYPGDAYGRGMRDHFWEAVEARGGHVVAASSYEPEATDFAEPIRRMIGFPLLTWEERKAIEERENALKRARRLPPEEAAEARKVILEMVGPGGDPLPPIVDFDAPFIPDSHDKIVLVAPQLAFHDVSGIQLLGTSGWVHEDLLKHARGHVRTAVMAALFHPQSRYTFVSDFVDRFATHFEAVPDVFAACAYDAANLVLVQLAAGRDSRDEVLDGVAAVHGYPGASGVTSFLHDGNARKRPFLLGVKGRRLIALD
jgi:ABC-type branched-subunit amino acid transport system substrate-binding protein